MAQVLVNDELIMMGNFWDFHNGCHGFDIPTFNGYESLASILSMVLEAAGKQVEVKTNEEWEYED